MILDDTSSSPWAAARREFGAHSVLRIIDLATGTQSFQCVRPGNAADLTDRELDGMTFILTDEPLSPEKRLAIIQQYDDAWRAARREPDKPRA